MRGAQIRSSVFRFLKIGAMVFFVPIILLVLLGVLGNYLNWSAERKAKAFCDAIEPGSDISLTIGQFEKDIGYEKKPGGGEPPLHYGYPEKGSTDNSHTFLFPGMIFDKAECDVSLTKNGKVVSKNSYFLYD